MNGKYQVLDPLSDAEREALTQDIQAHGVLVPVEVDENGEILDGHHRAAIAQQLSVSYTTVVRRFDSEEDKIDHVYRINLIRRHMDSLVWGRAFRRLLALRGTRTGQGARNDQTSATVAEVAIEIGVPERTARQRIAHVDAVDRYPELAQGYGQQDAITVAKNLDALPDPEREEKREALRQFDPPTVAALAEKPPPATGPTPHERATQDPAYRWMEAIGDLERRITAVHRLGGLAQVSRHWSTENKRAWLDKLDRLHSTLAEWCDLLNEELTNAPDVP